MSAENDDRQIASLIEAVHKLTATAEQMAGALGKLEALAHDMLRKLDEDRAEAKERQKKFDQEHEEFRERQQRWDERDKKWDEQRWWHKNPWAQPRELANLALMIAFAALAITLAILTVR
jgi:hypothetical protein